MRPMYDIGRDVHKRKISYCVKDGSGKVYAEGSLAATRVDLDHHAVLSSALRRKASAHVHALPSLH